MEGFKIINRTDTPKPQPIPLQNEVKYLSAKCKKAMLDYVIRIEKHQDAWYMMSAFKDTLAVGESTKGTQPLELAHGLLIGDAYACPLCGSKNIVRCKNCGKITCYDQNVFVCAHCANTGKVKGSIESVNTYSYKQSGKNK